MVSRNALTFGWCLAVKTDIAPRCGAVKDVEVEWVISLPVTIKKDGKINDRENEGSLLNHIIGNYD